MFMWRMFMWSPEARAAVRMVTELAAVVRGEEEGRGGGRGAGEGSKPARVTCRLGGGVWVMPARPARRRSAARGWRFQRTTSDAEGVRAARPVLAGSVLARYPPRNRNEAQHQFDGVAAP